MDALTKLATLISNLPAIGPKSARRIASFILKSSDEYADNLSNAILDVKKLIHPCSVCGSWCENSICDICSDGTRDKSKICIVEDSDDILAIESGKVYKGLYHVLGGRISPLNGVYPENLNFEKLKSRINFLDANKQIEIIIATNPNEEGETTAYYIKEILKDNKNIKFSRPAIGLASGGNLAFASQIAIIQAIANRQEL